MSHYHSHTKNGRTHLWEVPRLHELAKDLPVVEMPISKIRGLDGWSWERNWTIWDFLDHIKRVNSADLSHPVILSEVGWVMDGMHRICRALVEGHTTIKVVQFETDPEADQVSDVAPVGSPSS